jgi:fatty-acyl-CoA synthase
MSIPYFDCIAHHAMWRPDSLATVDLATGRRHCYQAFDDRTARLPGALREKFHLAPGNRVAVLAPIGTDTLEVQFACGRIGAIFVPLNWRLANAELLAILTDCTPAVLIFDPESSERAQDLAHACAIDTQIAFGDDYEGIVLNEARLSAMVPATLDDLSTILYTSRTTGRPKGTMITHGMNFCNTVHSTSVVNVSRSAVFLGLLPLLRTSGLNVFAYPYSRWAGR